METSTNTVLYSKNADQPLYPASAVKIMTCLVALENSSLDEQVTMTATGVSGVTDGVTERLNDRFIPVLKLNKGPQIQVDSFGAEHTCKA